MTDNYLRELLPKKTKAINAVKKANQIMHDHELICCANQFYEYKDGYYKFTDELYIRLWIKRMLGDFFTKNRGTEILHCLQVETFLELEELNKEDLLNVRNGMLDLHTFELLPQ